MPRDRLVETRDRVLAVSKTLPVPILRPVLLQGWMVGSRFTHEAESRYAPIEGEALAVADALDKARHFVLGCKNLTIAVDHRPLLKIFGDRSRDISNTRLRNLKEKTLRYRFKMPHIPGVRPQTHSLLAQPRCTSRTTSALFQSSTTPLSTSPAN